MPHDAPLDRTQTQPAQGKTPSETQVPVILRHALGGVICADNFISDLTAPLKRRRP